MKLGFVLGKSTDKETLRWVALGDSLTVGFGASPEQSYPFRILEKSLASHIKLELVKNLANGGHTLAKVQLLQLTRLHLYKPHIVSVWAGTNDLLLNPVMGKTFDLASRERLPTSIENFKRRMHELVEKCFKHSLKHLFVGKMHAVYKLPVASGWPEKKQNNIRAMVEGYNEVIESLSREDEAVSIIPLDKLSILVDPDQCMRDGIHPKPQVYEEVATCFWQVMQSSLLKL